jgi:hypothetical protein
MAERNRGRWKRAVGVFRFEPQSVWVGGERVLDGGRDAPLPRRRQLLWRISLAILAVAGTLLVLLSR